MLVLFTQITLFLFFLVMYYNAPIGALSSYLAVVLILVLVQLILFYKSFARRVKLSRCNLNNTLIFMIMYVVISFQAPLDYVLGNDSINYEDYFFSEVTINKSVTYSAILLSAFILGINLICIKKYRLKGFFSREEKLPMETINEKPILIITLLFWLLFALTINLDYVAGGHGKVPVDSLSVSFYGYYWRFSVIYIALKVWNKRCSCEKKGYVKSFPFLYVLSVILSVLLFLSARNRVYVIYLCVPLVMGYFAYSRKKVSLLRLFLGIGVIAVFFTFFKIFSLSSMVSGVMEIQGDLSSMEGYSRYASVSPFTAELAGSIYVDSLLFNMWYFENTFFYGLSIITGFFKAIPGVVTLFLGVTGLPVEFIQSGTFASNYVGSSYGLGTTFTSDLLVNIGFYPTIILMFFWGGICGKSDDSLFGDYDRKDLAWLVIALSVASQIAFLPRSSISDLIGTVVFNLLVVKFYIYNLNRNDKNIAYNRVSGA